MKFKIAFIGAGSITFTRKLLSDILSVKEFSDIEIAFMDIDPQNLDLVTRLCQRDIDANGLSIKILSTLDRVEAIKGAKYVITCYRIGRLEAFETDINIPLRYGVDQCVGDTLCAGGIMYGQRGIAEALSVCEDIKKYAAPDCMLLNYANPNAMMTWACNQFGKVPTLGLCHGVQGGQQLIAKAFGLDYEDIDIICAGINHQTWYISIKHNGEELTGKLLDAMLKNEDICRCEKVRLDILKNFGYFSTESNGHLSEYVSWYRKRPDEVVDWIETSIWINGETGGYLRHCTENRDWFVNDFDKWINGEPQKYDPEKRSREHGSYIIESLETGRRYRGHFNVVNNGCISNLPDDAIVEVPCYVDGNGISVPKVGDLPLGCAAVCNQSISVQRLAVYAAVNADIDLLRQAMLMDPLVGAVCNTAEIRQMTDEMLVAGEKWLPQYADEIAKAKKRLAESYFEPKHPTAGTMRKTPNTLK